MAVTPLYEPSEAEFERLYRRHARRVYRYALAVLRNPADAEDVTQTTFLNAFRAMRAGTEPELPENWLIRIAHNTCRTRFLRAARRPQEVPFDDSMRQLAVPEDEKPNLDEVLRALSRLPFNQRSALVMRELEGRSYEEIATALGVSASSVEALLFRARRSLRVRRNALRVLGLVQLPPSLETMLTGGAATTGGAVAGGGALLKLATFVVAAVTAGGAGYEAVQAYSAKPRVAVSAAAQGAARATAAQGRTATASSGGNAAAVQARGARTGAAAAPVRGARLVRPVAGSPAATVSAVPSVPGAAQPGAQPSTPSAPAPTAPATPQAPSTPTVPALALPSTPQLPAPPVAPPALPPPPALPAVPALPPPPPLPPPPELPKLP